MQHDFCINFTLVKKLRQRTTNINGKGANFHTQCPRTQCVESGVKVAVLCAQQYMS